MIIGERKWLAEPKTDPEYGGQKEARKDMGKPMGCRREGVCKDISALGRPNTCRLSLHVRK